MKTSLPYGTAYQPPNNKLAINHQYITVFRDRPRVDEATPDERWDRTQRTESRSRKT